MLQQRAVFHSGELAVQEKLGVAQRVNSYARNMYRDHMPQQHQDFYQQLPMLFVGHAAPDGNVWASVLSGEPGFVAVNSDKQLSIDALPPLGDPLHDSLEAKHHHPHIEMRLGVLGIELPTRRRNRMSASVSTVGNLGFTLDVVQTFGNCPQYIQTRYLTPIDEAEQHGHQDSLRFNAFSGEVKSLVESADTFFVASATHARDGEELVEADGADVSHRGGKPGFIKVESDDTLLIPDYMGNNHYNTFGNIVVNPNVGLLFIDFTSGDIYTMTGKAEILWEHELTELLDGAQRFWRFKIDHGFKLPKAMPYRFSYEAMSPSTAMTGTWQQAESRKYNPPNVDDWHSVVVNKKQPESKDITSFYFEYPVQGHTFKAGQYITLKINIDGKTHYRSYTVSNAPQDDFFRISVKKEGVVSRYLHESLSVGDPVFIRMPSGDFVLSNTDRHLVLLSAGIGITPMVAMYRSLLKEAVRTRQNHRVTMFNNFRHASDMVFKREIEDIQLLAKDYVLSKVVWGLSQPEAGVHQGRDYQLKGRISAQVLQQVLPIDNYQFYLCGPKEFVQDCYDMLMELGVNDDSIYAEEFGPSSLTRISNTHQSAEIHIAENALVEFVSSGVELNWNNSDGNLLAFAENHGIEVQSGCRAGSCGSCKVKLLEGNVHHEGAKFAVAKNEALLCCAKPITLENKSDRNSIKLRLEV